MNYLLACFDGGSLISIASSADGKSFTDLGFTYDRSPDSGFRDPSILKEGDTYWIAYTNVNLVSEHTTTFSIAKSVDGALTWTRVGTVDCVAAFDGGEVAPRVWAPEWIIDPADDSVHVIF